MLFKVTNKITKKYTYVGVLEFSAEEGVVVLPFWVQEQLGCKVNQLVSIENATLPGFNSFFSKLQKNPNQLLI